VFESGKDKLQKKKGFYELLGCDFILDEQLNPYLLEINSNPALFTDTNVLEQVITPLI
jgi:D-alanine-D-alanine ligase-like ATP-grasp enzyme